MVQAHCTNRPARSGHQVVEFDIQPPKLDVTNCDLKMSGADYRELLGLCEGGKWQQRQPPKGNGSSKYKGVLSKHTCSGGKKHSYWLAVIHPKSTKVWLGYFPYTPEGEMEAARAYDKAAMKLWGDNALTNQQYYGDLEL